MMAFSTILISSSLLGVSADRWEARCKLAVAYRLAAHYGWDQLVFNHITLKVPESDLLSDGPHFLINPFGLRFDEVTAPWTGKQAQF